LPSGSNRKINILLKILVFLFVAYGCHARLTTQLYTDVQNPIRADASDYFSYAYNLKNWATFGHGSISKTQAPEPDAYRSPGFPVFASVHFDLSKSANAIVKNTLYTQTVFQVFCFLLLTIVTVMAFGYAYSLAPIAIIWSFPHFISINTYFLTESLFASFLLLSFLPLFFLDKIQLNRVPWISAGCGLSMGYCALIRPTVEYFPLFVLLGGLLFYRAQLKNIALYVAAAMLPILLWKARNLISVGVWSDPTQLISAIYHGSFPGLMFQGDPRSYGTPYLFDPMAKEMYQGVGNAFSIIWQRIIASPWEYLQWFVAGKTATLWQWDIIAGIGDIYIYPVNYSPYQNLPDLILSHGINRRIHNIWVFIGLMTAFVITAKAMTGKYLASPFWLGCSLMIVYISLFNILTAPFPRYSIPFKVLLIPLAFYGLRMIFRAGIEWHQNRQSLS